MTLGRDDERWKHQKRSRAELIAPDDPSSPYRAVEVIDELRTQPNEHVRTLADIPDYSLARFAEKETLGVREILDVQDEQQPNGKIFKKVSQRKKERKKEFFFDIRRLVCLGRISFQYVSRDVRTHRGDRSWSVVSRGSSR